VVYDLCSSTFEMGSKEEHIKEMNMSVCGVVLLIIHVTLSDGSSTVNVIRLGLMLIGLNLNVSWRPCIIEHCATIFVSINDPCFIEFNILENNT
jgi:hypothetical protein